MYNWSTTMETGNQLIDSQHHQWINALNQLLDACAQGKGRDQIRSTLIFLQDYTAKHFNDEEKLQQQYRFPEYATHKRYHDGFKKVVRDIIEEYDKTGPTVVLIGKINSNLGGWFVNHIKKEDGKVAEHIRQAQAR